MFSSKLSCHSIETLVEMCGPKTQSDAQVMSARDICVPFTKSFWLCTCYCHIIYPNSEIARSGDQFHVSKGSILTLRNIWRKTRMTKQSRNKSASGIQVFTLIPSSQASSYQASSGNIQTSVVDILNSRIIKLSRTFHFDSKSGRADGGSD
jgi:hypothetical protein